MTGKEERKHDILKNKTYKKSNELINAMGKGTALSQKIFAIGMQNIHVDQYNSVVATISGSELRKMFNSKAGSLYEHIESLCDRTLNGPNIFDWNLILKDKKNGTVEAHQVVTDAKFENGTLELRYNSFLTDKIVDLQKGYTMLNLSETLSLKSVYSLRMYEIFKSAYDYRKSVTGDAGEHLLEFNLTELKLELGIISTGGSKEMVKEIEKERPDYDKIASIADSLDTKYNMYREYKVFNRSVLAKVKQEINSKTSIEIDYEPMKTGRSVTGVRFFLNKKKVDVEKTTNEKFKEESLDELVELMNDIFKYSEVKNIAEYANYKTEEVKKAYAYMLMQGGVESPVAYMKACIKNKYYDNKARRISDRKNNFANFQQNTYDFEELEKKLLDN